jgi:hypothetical protein
LICGHRLLRQQQAGALVEIGAARPQHFGCLVEGFHHDLAHRDVDLAEALVFNGEVSTGASDDLQRATDIATEMVTRY